MTRTSPLLALVAAAALAGCNSNGQTLGPKNEAKVDNSHVTLPPAIAASKIYRCADNQVVYVDWLSDNKSANVRTESGGTPTQVVAPEAGKPMTGPAGYSVEGTAAAASAKIAVPGHPAQSCKA